MLGYPPKGTHAHSMVQIFMVAGHGRAGRLPRLRRGLPRRLPAAGRYDQHPGERHPQRHPVFEELRRKGHEPVGVRLDSGDLAYLSIQAAKMLDEAGFPDTSIVLSNDLDELIIWQIITQIRRKRRATASTPSG